MVTDAWGEEKDRWPINVAINTNAWYLVNFYIIHILCFLYLLSSRCNSGNKMWYNLLLWFPPLTEQHVSRGTWPRVAAAGGGVTMMDARSQETLRHQPPAGGASLSLCWGPLSSFACHNIILYEGISVLQWWVPCWHWALSLLVQCVLQHGVGKEFRKISHRYLSTPTISFSLAQCAVVQSPSLSSPCSGRVIMLCFHSDVAEEINVNVPNINVLVL